MGSAAAGVLKNINTAQHRVTRWLQQRKKLKGKHGFHTKLNLILQAGKRFGAKFSRDAFKFIHACSCVQSKSGNNNQLIPKSRLSS